MDEPKGARNSGEGGARYALLITFIFYSKKPQNYSEMNLSKLSFMFAAKYFKGISRGML